MKIIAFITLLLLGTSAWAVGTQKIAGYAGETTGGVAFAFNKLGQKRKLGANVPVYEGETLITSKTANSSVIFTDGTTIELNPSTQFRVEEFRFGEEEEKPSAVFRMLKGGFRFISGLVNKERGGRLSFKTPTATIGVRGSAGSFSADGTIEVYEGTFTVATGSGSSNLNAGDTANTASGTVKKTQKLTKQQITKKVQNLRDQRERLADNEPRISGQAIMLRLMGRHAEADRIDAEIERAEEEDLEKIRALDKEIEAGEALLNLPEPCSDCGGTAYCPASPAILITDPDC